MRPKLEKEVRRIAVKEIFSMIRQFNCPVCGHLTLVWEVSSLFTDKVFCYVCGHTFRKAPPSWVDTSEVKP